MYTLKRIRENKEKKDKEEQFRKENYKTPSGFVLLSKFIKKRNLEIIDEFCDKTNKSDIDRKNIVEKYHKLNYYTPSVSQIIKNETKQFSSESENEHDNDN